MNKPHILVVVALSLLGLLSGPAMLKAYDKVFEHDSRISVLESRREMDHALLSSINAKLDSYNSKLDALMVQSAKQGAKLETLELAE